MLGWIVGFGLVGCGDPEVEAPTPPAEEVLALAVTGESCEPVGGPVQMVYGPQGSFHLELGAVVASTTGDIVLHIDVFDPETNERVAGTEANGTYIALADWDDTTGEGWASTEARIGANLDILEAVALGCSLAGREVLAQATVCTIDEEVCSTVDTLLVAESPPGLCP